MLSTTPDTMSRTVLVVEDADTCATLLEVALLRIPGVAVTCAGTGREALQLLGVPGAKVCALVTDLNMPLLDGFELIAQVRSDHRYDGMPIIVVSGDTDPRTPDRVTRLGVNAFFAKPYSPAIVRRALENLLNGSAASTSAQ